VGTVFLRASGQEGPEGEKEHDSRKGGTGEGRGWRCRMIMRGLRVDAVAGRE
jgi:hypothetical protein